MTNLEKVIALLDGLIESDLDRAERFIESRLTRIDLLKRQAARAAPAQRNLTVPEEKAIDAALFSGSKLVGVEFRDGAIRAAPAQPVTHTVATAPKRIYLNVFEHLEDDLGFPDDHEGITWCEDKIGDNDIPYVRADLAGAAPAQAELPTALSQFNKFWSDEDDGSDPVERLRAFCSFAMKGQDWLDVEPFFDALTAARDLTAWRAEAMRLGRIEHYYCEDSWYSCPQAEGGCSDEAWGTECTCGADSHNAALAAHLEKLK
jgi:hypothetical protein